MSLRVRIAITTSILLASTFSLHGQFPANPETTRVLPIAGDAFAGSAVNTPANGQHVLYTHGRWQFAAYYTADGTLALAKRELGQDVWQTTRTSYRGKVADGHNSIALIVDGAGYLHVAWDHHGNRLNYARSVAPLSLELGAIQPMDGQLESNVTYPSFYRQADGNLLATYRDGASGRGNLVLKRYDVAQGSWQTVHANLIDGEGQRSAYPSLFLDPRGNLHLAWVWRDSPDVATNHDIAYVRSSDGGQTWTDVDGRALTLPLTQANAAYAVRIPENRSLMNPPTVSADVQGRPVIVNYWTPEGSDIPQYHLMHFDGSAWNLRQITQRTTPFNLAGANTKRPPISRAVVVTYKSWRTPQIVHVAYRDDERGGKAVLATLPDLANPQSAWEFRELTADGLGAWEPAYDPAQWQRLEQLHLLVSKVDQLDGNDARTDTVPPQPVANLIWSPFLDGLYQSREAHDKPTANIPATGGLERAIAPAEVKQLCARVTEWQLAQPYGRDPRGWEIAPFYIGALEVAREMDLPGITEALEKRFDAQKWEAARRVYHADDYCVIQAYAEAARQLNRPEALKPSLAYLDRILATPPTRPLDWGVPHSDDRWNWCDALFMGPVSWLEAFHATGDRRYLDFMNQEWWVTTDILYRAADGFYARDESYQDLREPNGQHLYWSRGNGWVAAGLARVLERFPQDHPDYPRYVALYREMMTAVLAAQQPDGLWRPGLLDPTAHPAQEASGSSFYTFALTWGVNHGLLDRADVEPAVRRAWNALSACVDADGALRHIQPIGAAPEGFNPQHTDLFGVGAFLLAGSEVFELVGGQ